MTYYNEVKQDIIEAMEEDYIEQVMENYAGADSVYDTIYELIDNDVTGNIDGSYYCSSYKARQQAYNFADEVMEALEFYGCYEEELEKFKIFEILADEKYINVENMTLNYDNLDMDEDEKECIIYDFEEVSDLNFEALDVITRSYYFSSLLYEVLENEF